MDETIYVILKVLFDFALEVWFSIEDRYVIGKFTVGRYRMGSCNTTVALL